jgi:hypothetical protein
LNPALRFPYTERDPAFGSFSGLPYLPLQLSVNGVGLSVTALVDSGATLNVLPYDVGEQLGFSWNKQTTHLQLAGNLARSEARAVARWQR